MSVRWSPEMIAWLRERAPLLRSQALAREAREHWGLRLTRGGLQSAKRRYGVRTAHPSGFEPGDPENPLRLWTPKHLAWLRRTFRQIPERDLEAAMARAFPECGFSAAQITAALSNYCIRSGRDGRFKPGSTPWNKGLSGFIAGGRSAETQFQPGHQRAVRRAIGAERISKDGYLEIKVAEPNPYTGGPTRFRLKHRVVWETAHGLPVPAQHVIVFRDGDRRNFAINNLVCIPRAALARLNQDGHGDLTGDLRGAAIALAELKTEMFRRQRS